MIRQCAALKNLLRCFGGGKVDQVNEAGKCICITSRFET